MRSKPYVKLTSTTVPLESRRVPVIFGLGELSPPQWSHGAPGETKYSLNVHLPMLRKREVRPHNAGLANPLC